MNIFKYLNISIYCYVMAVFAILTASFNKFIILFSLILVHEIGHFLFAFIFKVKVDKIYLYPFGGISKFYLPINISFIKELIILIAGPLFQIIFSKILVALFYKYSIIINVLNKAILLFNMLPIYPLDGGKLFNLIITKIFPYKKSMILSIYISYITIFIYIVINIHELKLTIISTAILLLIKVSREKRNIAFNYEKFLLERYLNNYKFKDCIIIKNDNNFFRYKAHLVLENNKYYTENEYLEKKLKKF